MTDGQEKNMSELILMHDDGQKFKELLYILVYLLLYIILPKKNLKSNARIRNMQA